MVQWTATAHQWRLNWSTIHLSDDKWHNEWHVWPVSIRFKWVHFQWKWNASSKGYRHQYVQRFVKYGQWFSTKESIRGMYTFHSTFEHFSLIEKLYLRFEPTNHFPFALCRLQCWMQLQIRFYESRKSITSQQQQQHWNSNDRPASNISSTLLDFQLIALNVNTFVSVYL